LPTRNAPCRVPFARTALVVLVACGPFVSCASEEQRAWEAAQAQKSVAAYEEFLNQFPESGLSPQAEAMIIELLPVIPFASERDGGFAVYTMEVDGSGET
jgi:hypothetical protein